MKRTLAICFLSVCLGYSWYLYYTRPYPNKFVEGTWTVTATNGKVYKRMKIQTSSLGVVNAVAPDGSKFKIEFQQMVLE